MKGAATEQSSAVTTGCQPAKETTAPPGTCTCQVATCAFAQRANQQTAYVSQSCGPAKGCYAYSAHSGWVQGQHVNITTWYAEYHTFVTGCCLLMMSRLVPVDRVLQLLLRQAVQCCGFCVQSGLMLLVPETIGLLKDLQLPAESEQFPVHGVVQTLLSSC